MMHKVPRLIRILEKTDLHSLTQHGGSSGISKIGRSRDPSYRIITGQGLGFSIEEI